MKRMDLQYANLDPCFEVVEASLVDLLPCIDREGNLGKESHS